MNKILFVLFFVYLLSACQGNLMNDSSNDIDLSTQYTAKKYKTNKAAEINTQLGAGYIGNGRYDRALLKLKKAIKQDPDYALAHNYLGILYGRLERPVEARKQFERSLELASDDSSLLNNYAIFLCEDKKYTEAQKLFKKVINNPLYINRANAYQSSGWCALENDNIELSEKMYRKAIEINATMPAALLGLAKINYINKSYEYAWSYFQRYDHQAVPNADALWLGINILRKLAYPNKNLLSSYELQLKSKFPDSDETKLYYQGKQEY